MTLEFVYLWAAALSIIAVLLYLWRRLYNQRHNPASPLLQKQPPRWAASLLNRLWASPSPITPSLTAHSSEGEVNAVAASPALATSQVTSRRTLPPWLSRPRQWLAGFFQVTAGQVVLLLLGPCFSLLAILSAGDQPMARHWLIAAAAWLLSIGLAVAGSWQRGQGRVKVSRGELLFTAILFAVALLLRGTAVAQIPTTFSGDEGSVGLNALAFAEGRANNLFIVGWFSFPSLYSAIQSLGILLLGQTIEALRLVSAVAGALAVVATYWLARSLFDRTTAVLAATYLAASHFHIHFSRLGLNNIWDSFFGLLVLLGLWYGWKSGQRVGFIICGLALGLGQYFYVSMRALPLVLLVWTAVATWYQPATLRQRLPGLILATFIALIVVLPLAAFFAQHPAEFNAPLNRVDFMGTRLVTETDLQQPLPVQSIGRQVVKAALAFTHEPLRMWYNPGAALLLPGAAALFLAGVLWGLVHFDLRYLLLFLPLLAVVAANALTDDVPAAQRYVLAAPLAAIVMAAFLGQIARRLGQIWPKYRRIMVVLTAVMIISISLADLHYYFLDIYDEYVLGGFNTETATAVAFYLRDEKPEIQQVFFFGLPRMGFFTHSTIPYLTPHVAAEDVPAVPTEPLKWPVTRSALFIFLPERLNELEALRPVYPNGRYREFHSRQGQLMFAVYEVNP